MVIYDLICDLEHTFEGWFKSEDDFYQQQAKELLTCPSCESRSIRKLPTASYVSTVSAKDSQLSRQHNPSPIQNKELVNQLKEFIVNNTENVGSNFAEEAKKIHYGEAPERGIRGQATAEEVRELAEEGVDVLSLPGILTDKQKLN